MAQYRIERTVTYFAYVEADNYDEAQDQAEAMSQEPTGIVDPQVWTFKFDELTVDED